MTITPDPSTWTPSTIAAALGFGDCTDLQRAVACVDHDGYVPFRSKAMGGRAISAPRDWLKDLQDEAHRTLLLRLPVSSAAFDRAGLGTQKGAVQHVRKRYITTIDIEKCFPSTTAEMAAGALRAIGLSDDVAGLLTRLCTYKNTLPQGAPTSTALLNVVLHATDTQLQTAMLLRRGVYTRYVDDMAFSSDQPLRGLAPFVARVLRSAGYRMHRRKVATFGPGDVALVTGIVVGDRLRPQSKHLKLLRSEVRRRGIGRPSLTDDQFRGLVAWVCYLDPALAAEFRPLVARSTETVAGDSVQQGCSAPVMIPTDDLA